MTVQARVGLVVVLLAIGLLLWSPGQHRRAPVIGNRFHLVFTQAGGLREGDQVKVAGVPKGVVESIEFATPEQQKEFSLVSQGLPLVIVTAAMEGFVHIPVASSYSVESKLSGERWVNITPAGGDDYVVPGETFFAERQTDPEDQLTKTLRTFKILSEQTRELRDEIADPDFRRQVKDTASNFRFYSRELAASSESAPEMLAEFEEQLDRQEVALQQRLAQFEEQIARAENLLTEMVPKLESQLAQFEQQVIANEDQAQAMLEKAVGMSEEYRDMVAELETRFGDQERMEALADQARRWSQRLDDLAAIATDLHMISSDPQVRADLKAMITKLKDRSAELKARVEKLERTLESFPVKADGK